MSQRHPALLAAFAVVFLAGCNTTTDPRPPETPSAPPAMAPAPTPVAPPKPVDARPATIKGSEESSTLLDNFTAFIRSVDGQPVSAGRQGWNQPLTLTPGEHRLTVEFTRGSFFARTELQLNARPGAAYELQQANDAQVYGQHTFCDFWIVDLATQEKTSPPKRVGLEKVKAN